ncbi:MAG: hypothetical protein AAF557_26185 [Pseudomonadota bacterium]
MPDHQGPQSEEVVDKFVVPADLPLNKASEVRETALKTLGSAKGAVLVDLDGDDPSVCALQLLIATKRSADGESLELKFSDSAKAALEEIDMT